MTHERTLETRAMRKRLPVGDWRTWVEYRYSCACGWRTGWYKRLVSARRAQDHHPATG